MLKSFYTYLKLILISILIPFLFLDEMFFNNISLRYAFFIVFLLITASIPLRKILKKDTFSLFESKFNYFLDEFSVYIMVILLSLHGFAPLWVVIIYFYKDATIGAVRNFAIKNNERLHEKYGYKLDKVVQYSIILAGAYAFSFGEIPAMALTKSNMIYLFFFSAAVSAISLIVFVFMNKRFMVKIQDN